MPPEAFEFVKMFLNFARPVAGSGILHQFDDEFFDGACGLPLIKGRPLFSPLRRQSSETEDVAIPKNPVATFLEASPCRARASRRRICVTDELQQPHQREERVARDSP